MFFRWCGSHLKNLEQVLHCFTYTQRLPPLGIFYFNKMDNLELLQEIRKILDEKNKSILSDD
jgi:hypothetical protein